MLVIIMAIMGMASAQPMHKSEHGMPGTPMMERVQEGMQEHNITPMHTPVMERVQERIQEKNQTCPLCTPIKERERIREKIHEHLMIRDKEEIKERIREIKVKQKIAKIQVDIQRAKEKCEQAKHRYEKAKEMYMKLRMHGLKDPETFRYAKQYVCFGVDYIGRWLERLMVQVQNENMGEDQKEKLMVRIQNCLMALNESKEAVNSSTTPEELEESVEKLKKTWNDIMIKIKSIVGQIAVAKLEVVISKTEDVALRIEGEIEALNATGVDVTELEELLNDCLEKLDLAREKLEEANEKFEDMLTADNPNELYVEGRHLLMEARDLIREAFADIKEIYHEIQHLRVGQLFFGNETGELLVVGSGTAEISFTGVALIIADGDVTISPAASVVTIVGFEGGVEGGVSMVSGHGKAVVRGENVTVKVEGDFMRIFVKGKGTATLSGEGIYKLKRSPHEKMEEGTFGNVTLEFGVVE